jgi:dihydroorotase-like cyclic amidohydrolase
MQQTGGTCQLDDWPDGRPPAEDKEAMESYLSALRQWQEARVAPVTEAEWQAARTEHGLD